MLQAKNISFHYPKSDKWILRNFSADFKKNEITAITGPNGCGKTTLSRVLVGIEKPQRGNVYLDDVDINQMSLAEIGKKIGLVMQEPCRQIFCTSVWDEVAYGLKNLNLSFEEIREKTHYYLKYFQLWEHRDKFPFEMSYGEIQRLVLAAVLAMEPEYLILDEPTASLDVFRQKLLGEQLLRVQKENRCGIIIISHDRKFIDEYAQNFINMEVAKNEKI
jgi:energy-coupling factor transport system ATP-binding protein